MDRYRGPSLASPVPVRSVNSKPEGNSRPRKKLQKGGAKQKGYLGKRPGSGASNEDSKGNKFDTAVKLVTHQAGVIAQPSIPLPPDLSDSKWLDYIRRSGLLSPIDTTHPKSSSLTVPVAIIPEFSHLTINDASARLSLDKMSADSPTSSNSTVSTMRRRAKTPVFSIGQLEGMPYSRDAFTANKTSSVELIAEQYRALLESRDSDSVYSDALSEPSLSRQGFRDDEVEIRRQRSSEDLASDGFLQPPSAAALAHSPTSDDGTLVAFDEETVYFKPVSFSPEPLSPLRTYESALPSPQLPQDNLSLQICLDLLTRELSSAVSDRPRRVGTEASALQIWVMIEAYERLRDSILDMRIRLGNDEMRGVEMMFDTWLRALYIIHDSLTGDARASESDYDTAELVDEPLD
jgi:hypothetical protein